MVTLYKRVTIKYNKTLYGTLDLRDIMQGKTILEEDPLPKAEVLPKAGF